MSARQKVRYGLTLDGLPPGPRPQSVEAVLDRLGIEYDDRGRELKGYCQVHDDFPNPSCYYSAEKGVWHCFNCGASGNMAQLVEMVCDGVTLRMAKRWVHDLDLQTDPDPDRDQDAGPEWDESCITDYDPPPRWALRQRGITAKAARRFEIRWDADDDSWVLPIRSPDGVLRGCQFKWQSDPDRDPLTTDDTRVGLTLFGIAQFTPGTVAFLVESPLDVAVLATAGFAGGLASFGAGVTRQQAMLLSTIASQIVLCLDNDKTGQEGEVALLKLLAALPGYSKPPVYSFNYGDMKGKDVGDLDDDQIRWGIENAIPRAK